MSIVQENDWVVIDGKAVIPRSAEIAWDKTPTSRGYVISMEFAFSFGHVVIASGITSYREAKSFVRYLNGLRGGYFGLAGREPIWIYDHCLPA